MSTREHLIRITMEAINTEADSIDTSSGNVFVNYARAAVDAVLPLITDPKQLLGVPEGSRVVATNDRGQLVADLAWRSGKLHSDNDGSYWTGRPPKWLLDQGLTLTVVWMP